MYSNLGLPKVNLILSYKAPLVIAVPEWHDVQLTSLGAPVYPAGGFVPEYVSVNLEAVRQSKKRALDTQTDKRTFFIEPTITAFEMINLITDCKMRDLVAFQLVNLISQAWKL